MSQNFIGAIILFAPPNFNLRNYASCSGQIIAISQNQALFALIGTTYGGNGTSTFGLPDLRGRVPVGTGNGPGLSPYAAGQMGGTEAVTLTQQQMPLHNHLVNAQNGPGTATPPTGGFLAITGSKGGATQYETYAASATSSVQLNTGTVSLTGGSQSHTNIQPYLGMNYFICTLGIFPSRN